MTFALLRELDLLLRRLANGEPLPLGVDQKNMTGSQAALALRQKRWLSSKRWIKCPSFGKGSLGALIPYLITASYLPPFCVGVAVTLAWHSYATLSTDQKLAALRQSVDQAQQSVDQLTAKVQQISGDIAAQQAILRGVSAPPPPALRRGIN